jgi:hypothetical protein
MRMKVSELVEQLGNYNPDADVDVIAMNKRQDFSLTYGDCEGATKENCAVVSFYVDELNQSESAG